MLGVGDVLNFGGWTLAGGFSFTAAEGAGLNYVGLSDGGMAAADAGSATTYNLGWPLALAGTQQWTLGQNNTLNVNAPIAGAGSLTVNGKARVNFNTPSSYAGNVTLTNGTFYITATNAVGGPGGTLYFTLAYGTLHFAGDVAIDRPITFLDTNNNNYMPFYIDANSTVDFNRKVYLPSKQRAISVKAGSVARFHGGLAASTCFRFSGSGTVVIDSEPLNMGDRFYAYGPTIELNVAYNRINGNVGNWSSGTIKTGVPYALCHKVPLGGDTYQRILLNGATIDLCGNDQSIGVLGGGSGKITSATPATFHLVDDYVNTETQFGSGRQTNNVPFEGCVSFAKEGRLNYWLKAVSPTCGDLSVTNGTLRPAGGRPHRRRGRADAPGLLRQHEGVRTLHRRAEAASWRLRRHGVGRPQETRLLWRHGHGPAGRPRRRHRHDGDLPMKRTYRSGRFRSSPCRARSCRASGETRGKL